MAATSVHSHYTDVMGEFDDAMTTATSLPLDDEDDVSQTSVSLVSNNNAVNTTSNNSDTASQHVDASTVSNKSNNMFAGFGKSISNMMSPRPSKDAVTDKTPERRDSSLSKYSSDDLASTDLSYLSTRTSSLERWRTESGTDKTGSDTPKHSGNAPGVLASIRENLNKMTGRIESDKFRESALRLESRMSEILSESQKKPWEKADSKSAETFHDRMSSRQSRGSLGDSVLTDIKAITNKLSDTSALGSFVGSQIEVMNSVLDAVKDKGTSVDPQTYGHQDGSIMALYDTLNIEKLRLNTMQTLLNSINVASVNSASTYSYRTPSTANMDDYQSNSSYSRLGMTDFHKRMNSLTSGLDIRPATSGPTLDRAASIKRLNAMNVSMNRHVTSTEDLTEPGKHVSRQNLRKKTDRKGTSQSSGNLPDKTFRKVNDDIKSSISSKMKHPVERRAVERKRSSRTTVREPYLGMNKSQNKSQNWTRSKPKVGSLGPEIKGQLDKSEIVVSPRRPRPLLEYPGIDFKPQSVFSQSSLKTSEIQQINEDEYVESVSDDVTEVTPEVISESDLDLSSPTESYVRQTRIDQSDISLTSDWSRMNVADLQLHADKCSEFEESGQRGKYGHRKSKLSDSKKSISDKFIYKNLNFLNQAGNKDDKKKPIKKPAVRKTKKV